MVAKYTPARGTAIGDMTHRQIGERAVREYDGSVKRIGFLSFGHWSDSYGSQVRTAADSLVQSLELAVAAEELGADGAYFRVHHFARQLAHPFRCWRRSAHARARSKSARP